MFTWICPKCGREVPPAYTECPDCEPKESHSASPAPPAETAKTEPAPVSAAPPSPEYTPPAHTPSEPQYQPPPPFVQPAQPGRGDIRIGQYVAPPPRPAAGLPTWLMAIVFALAFLGLGAGIYWTVGYFRGRGTPTPSITVENPAAKAGANVNPYQRYIEVSGVRFTEDPKKKENTIVKFVITNHSGADMTGLGGNVTVWGRTQKSEEEAAGTFAFSTNLGPYESKDLSAPLKTKLKIYELPDWQNVSTDVQITAPAVSGG